MKYNFQTFRGDLFSGITVAIVGLPLALAYGAISGLGAIAGMYGAIAVGFFTAVFGGARSVISSPTGPMSVAMAVIITSHAGSLAEAFTIAIMAGLVQVIVGITRIGRFVAYTPYSVISRIHVWHRNYNHIATDPSFFLARPGHQAHPQA